MYKKKIFVTVTVVVCAVVLWLLLVLLTIADCIGFKSLSFVLERIYVKMEVLVNMSGLDIPMTLKGILCLKMNFQE
mgnify:CR=1 FL=1